MTHRIAVVTGIPAPYREPVFDRLAQRPNVDLQVFYCADGHSNVAWSGEASGEYRYKKKFPVNFTPKRFRRLPFLGYSNIRLRNELVEFDPTYVIIYGYNQLSHWLAFRFCMKRGIPFALRSDSNVHIDKSESWQSGIRRSLLRWLVRRAAAVLAVGSANADYWRSFGATDGQIFSAPYAVDNDRIAKLAGERQPPGDALRFLYVGRLISRKCVDLLVEAFNRIAGRSTRCTLTIVGDGPERERLQAMQTAVAADRTSWLGKLPNEEAIKQYSKADVFVLPSRYEPWGLVVNEAMAAGLPVIADGKCGAALDLVRDGVDGTILSELSGDTVESAMNEYIRNPQLAGVRGVSARERVAHWNFDRTVDGFMEALESKSSTARMQPAGGNHG